MRSISKRLISVLSIICLLTSLILPAGVIPTIAGDTSTTDPIVTEILFPGSTGAASSFSPAQFWYFGGDSAENAYTITFDYYLPKAVASLELDSVSGMMTTVSGNRKMATTPGHHKFEWTTWTTAARGSQTGQFVAQIKAPAGTEMYLWNWSVKIKGAEVIPSSLTEANAATNGTAGGRLSTYAWSKYMDDPIVTEITFPGTGTTKWSPKPAWYYGGDSEANAYTVSFDYYLPKTIGGARFYSVSGATTVSGGTIDLTAGYHHFEWVGYCSSNNGQLVTAIEATGGDEMYLWNWSVKINGAEVVPTDKSAEWNGDTNGTLGKFLGEYDWAKYINVPVVTEISFPGATGTSSSFSPKKFWYFGGDSVENAYTITFDYYLPKAVASLELDSVSGMMNTVSGNRKMNTAAGHHTFEWTTWTTAARGSQTGQFVAQIKAPAGTEMYLWNWSVKIKGQEVTPSTLTEANAATNGTEGQYLIDYDWHKYMDDPIVTEITFPGTGTTKWSPKPAWYYGGDSEANAYTVSFDYYLPKTIGGARFYSVSGATTVSGGTIDLTAGYHHFEWVGYCSSNNGQLVTAIEATGGDQMYIWNWSVKVNNAEVLPTDKSAEWNGDTNGTAGKILGQYDWAKYINSPKVTEILFPGSAGTSSSFSPKKFWYFGGDSAENAYTITFDYYLPKAVASLELDSVSGMMTTVSGNRKMATTAGFHTFEWTTWTTLARGSQTGQFVAQIKAPAGTEMYLWNWSVKIKGSEVEPSTLTEANAATNGTEGKYLVDYVWANPDAEEPEKTVTSIEIATPPTKAEYEIGEELNTAGLSVKINYSDETSDTITEGFEVSGFDSATAGEKTVNVGYEGFSATFTVTVNEPAPTNPIVTEILFPGSAGTSSTFSPKKFWYFGGDSAENAYTITFDYYLPKAVASLEMDSVSGMMNTVSGNRKMATTPGHHKFEWTTWTTVARGSQTGQFVAQIKAPAGTEMYLWNWSVKIKGSEVEPSTLTEANAATNGTVGDELPTYPWHTTMDDPIVTEITFPGTGTTKWSPKPAWYYGGNSEANAYTVSFDYYLPKTIGGARFYSVSGATTVSGGTIDLTAGIHHFEWVGYCSSNNGQLVTAIEATGGDEMYLWNWSVKINGNEVTPTDKSAEWNGDTNGTPGKLINQYNWYNAEAEKEVVSIEILTPPTKTTYEIGEAFDMAGLSLKVNYDDLTNGTITEGFTVSGFDSALAGTKTVTVTYEGKTATFTVTVNAAAEVPDEEKIVTEIDFTTGTTWVDAVYREADMSATNPYIVTFEYYLPTNSTIKFDSVAGSTTRLEGSTSATLQKGHHTFIGKYTTTAGGKTFAPRLTNEAKDAKLYIWDYSITLNGVPITAKEPYSSDATVTEDDVLTSYDWYETMNIIDPTVTEIVFPANGSNATSTFNPTPFWYFGGDSEEKAYTITFDYFLPEEVASLKFGSISGSMTTVSGSNTMKTTPGHHKVEWTTWTTLARGSRTGQFVAFIEAPVGTEMYLWNWSVKINGVEVEGDPMTEAQGQTRGTIGNELSTYPWYPTMDNMEVDKTNPFVTKVDIASGKTWYVGQYRDRAGTQDEYIYEFSFEYYMPDEYQLSFSNGPGWMSVLEGSADLIGGHHTMSVKVKVTKYDAETGTGPVGNAFIPLYKNTGADATLYVWNMTAKLNGQEIELKNVDGVTPEMNATLDMTKKLKQYEWAIPGDDGIAPMDKYQTDTSNPYVTAIDLSAGNKWYIGEYRDKVGMYDEYVWDVEFEYFMPNPRIDLSFSNGPGFMTVLEGSPKLTVGYHTVKIKARVTKYTETEDPETGEIKKGGAVQNAFIPIYSNDTAHDGMLYVWNMKVKLNGEEIQFKPFNQTETAKQAPIDATKRLKDYDWHATMDSVVDTTPPDVIAIDFSKGERWLHSVVRAPSYSLETPYVITFDYFLPEEYSNTALVLDSVAGMSGIIGGDAPYFVSGHHKFHGIYRTGAQGNTFAPTLIDKTKTAKLYIWNFKIMTGDVEVLIGGTEHLALTSAGVDISKRLNEFDWYKTMDQVPVVENKKQDSQYMIKIDNYFFDVNTSQTLHDQEFRQLVGVAKDYETGTFIKPNTTYVFSFDYYSAENLGSKLRVWNMHSGSQKANTSFVDPITGAGVGVELEYDGRYHVQTEFTTLPDQYDISVGLGVGVDGAGYYWNFSLVEKDTGKEMLRNTALTRPAPPTEANKTFANWITNSAEVDFTGNFNWIPMNSDEAKLILALKEGETLPEVEEEEEEEEEDNKDKEEEEVIKDNPLGEGTLYSSEYDIAMDFADASGMGEEYSLDIYPYGEGELAASILEALGDLRYVAYDIQLVLDGEFIQPEKDIFMALPIPEGFDHELVRVYYADEYGRLIDTEAYVDGNYLMVQYSVLGTFIIAEGEALEVYVPGSEDEPATDGDKPADTKPDKKPSKKPAKNTGWILWVAIGGGVLLLAAAGVVVLVVLKKKKGASVSTVAQPEAETEAKTEDNAE